MPSAGLGEMGHHPKSIQSIPQPPVVWGGSKPPCALPEPHHPHLVMEDGTMTYPEYEAHIRSRRDYARISRKDNSGERQVTGHGHHWPSRAEEEEGGRQWDGGEENLGMGQGV